MKTAMSVLHEMMTQMGKAVEYECVSQSGLQHLSSFEYRCRVRGLEVRASARSKKEAKQEAARLMLAELATHGEPVPPPYNLPPQPKPEAEKPALVAGANSHVMLLHDLCEEYHLPAAEYELVGDTGPPHNRQFTVRVRVGQHERLATNTTKKAARQHAAAMLYNYMRENLSRLTKDYDQEEALVRAHERAMERYIEVSEERIWRPDLGQRIADYHLGLKTHIEAEKCEMARKIVQTAPNAGEAADEATLHTAATALGLSLSFSQLPGERSPISVVQLTPTSPPLAFAGLSRHSAILNMLKYLRLALDGTQVLP